MKQILSIASTFIALLCSFLLILNPTDTSNAQDQPLAPQATPSTSPTPPPIALPTDTPAPPPTDKPTPQATPSTSPTPPPIVLPTDTPQDPSTTLPTQIPPTNTAPPPGGGGGDGDNDDESPAPPTRVPTPRTTMPTANTLQEALLLEGQKKQELRFNRDAALQRYILRDQFVPNSPEVSVSYDNVLYRSQRAESLISNKVRVYYVEIGDWNNIKFLDPSSTVLSSLEMLLISEVEKRQVIQFNPDAALQQRIFADKFVPNSPEFRLLYEGTIYVAQRAENLATGAVRIYYVKDGDWLNVKVVERQ